MLDEKTFKSFSSLFSQAASFRSSYPTATFFAGVLIAASCLHKRKAFRLNKNPVAPSSSRSEPPQNPTRLDDTVVEPYRNPFAGIEYVYNSTYGLLWGPDIDPLPPRQPYDLGGNRDVGD